VHPKQFTVKSNRKYNAYKIFFDLYFVGLPKWRIKGLFMAYLHLVTGFIFFSTAPAG